MIGRFEPDCKCKNDKGNPFPRPKIFEIQVDKIPIEIEYIIECGNCNKPWQETCLVREIENGNHNS